MQIQRHALLLILGYVGTVAGTGGAGYYFYEEYKAARNEEAGITKQIGLADIKIGRIPSLETDVICLRENLTEIVKILPDTKEVEEFVTKLQDFANEADVAITKLNPQRDRSKKKSVFDKVIYSLSMDANVSQFLEFMSLCEGWDRFARVTSVDIKAGDWSEEKSREEVFHEISMEIETYAYAGNEDLSKLTKIQKYDKQREQLRDEIVSRRADIRVERYTLVPNPLRRDLFIDPRRRLVDEGDGGLPYPEQKALVEDLARRAVQLEELAKTVGSPGTNFIRRLEIDTEIDDRSSALKGDLDQVIVARSITDHALKRRIERDVMPILKTLLERDQAAFAAATIDDLRRFVEDMSVLLDESKFERVLDKYRIIEGRVDAATLDQEGAALLHLIETAATHAQCAMDFASLDLKIGGVIVGESRSVVVINSRVLSEGDALEEGLLIHRITSDRIEFEYRGVILTRGR